MGIVEDKIKQLQFISDKISFCDHVKDLLKTKSFNRFDDLVVSQVLENIDNFIESYKANLETGQEQQSFQSLFSDDEIKTLKIVAESFKQKQKSPPSSTSNESTRIDFDKSKKGIAELLDWTSLLATYSNDRVSSVVGSDDHVMVNVLEEDSNAYVVALVKDPSMIFKVSKDAIN